MTFDTVFMTLPIGTVLSVSDGAFSPPQSARFRYACWRSHNFRGPLLEKIASVEGGPRALVIADSDAPCASRAYTVREDAAHTFTLLP